MNLVTCDAINEQAEGTIWAVRKKHPGKTKEKDALKLTKKECESKPIQLKNSANQTEPKPAENRAVLSHVRPPRQATSY